MFALYLKRTRGSEISCAHLLSFDESERVEFKSSLMFKPVVP